MKNCPKCKSISRHRLKRRGFVKYLPGFRAYECDNCCQTYTWSSFLNRSFKASYK